MVVGVPIQSPGDDSDRSGVVAEGWGSAAGGVYDVLAVRRCAAGRTPAARSQQRKRTGCGAPGFRVHTMMPAAQGRNRQGVGSSV